MELRPEQQSMIADICGRYHVQRLSLFGSAAVDRRRPDSDVDVLVEFIPGRAPSAFRLAELKDELSTVFDGSEIDLAFPSILQNPFRQREIVPQLQTLFA